MSRGVLHRSSRNGKAQLGSTIKDCLRLQQGSTQDILGIDVRAKAGRVESIS